MYAELLDWTTLSEEAVWRPVRDRGIELAIAIQPRDIANLPALVEALEGVSVLLWPLLDDGGGRWPSLGNLDAFRRHVDRVRDALGPRRDPLLLDLEPPIAATRALLRLHPGPLREARATSRERAPAWRRYVRDLVREGHRVDAVVPPPLLWGPPWDDLLATPPTDLGFHTVEVMGYSSLFEGYGRGLIDRRIAKDLLYRMCRGAAARGWRVGVGLSGGGALGDERALRDHGELREDVAIATAAGTHGLSLHSLEGALRSGHYEAWLDALVEGRPTAVPELSLRGSLLWGGGIGIGRIVERVL